MKITRCFACFCADDPEMGITKCDKQKLSRKKKKLLKKLLDYGCYWYSFGFDWGYHVSVCGVADFWKENRDKVKKLTWLLKHHEAFRQIKRVCDTGWREPMATVPTGGFGWCWEYDNGLYTEGGVMPFMYEDPDDGTWSYEETCALLDSLGVSGVKTDKELVEAVLLKLKRGE